MVRDSYGSPVFHGFMQDSTERLLQTRHIMHVNQLDFEFELEEDGHVIPSTPSPASDHLPIPDIEEDEHVEADEVPDYILHIQPQNVEVDYPISQQENHIQPQNVEVDDPVSQQENQSENLLSQNIHHMPTSQEAHRTFIPTATHVPKSARNEWARLLADVVNQVVSKPGDEKYWINLFILARCLLASKPSSSQGLSFGHEVKDRIKRWRNGDAGLLWQEALANHSKSSKKARRRGKKKSGTEKSQEEKNIIRCKRLLEEGQFSRAAEALSSLGIDQSSQEAYDSMIKKHPQCNKFDPPTEHLEADNLKFLPADVKKAVNSFKAGSAPGPTGLRAEHLKEALSASATHLSMKALNALTSLVNNLSVGKLPAEVSECFSGARLFAGRKKDGGFRPIAVGNILRRLTSKCIMNAVSAKAAAILRPFQFGVGVKGGCEAVIHSLNSFLKNPEVLDNEKIFLQVDLKNAFNEVERKVAFETIRELLPEVASWTEATYGVQAQLIYDDKVILSCKGWHQGDPVAGLLFALSLHPVLVKIHHDVPTLSVNAWIHDDGTLAGSAPDLMSAWQIIQSEGPRRGLVLSSGPEGKSAVWSPFLPTDLSEFTNLGIKRIEDSGLKHLGAALGSDNFSSKVLDERIDKVIQMLSKLPLLEDAHQEYSLLRCCFSMPKLSYTLRTLDPSAHLSSLQRYDDAVRNTIESIVGTCITDDQWLQSSLPISMGGLGLRKASDHGPAAYIASVLESKNIIEEVTKSDFHVDLSSVISIYSQKAGQELVVESLISAKQKDLSNLIDKHNLSTLLSSAQGQREIARLNSVGLPKAGAWLQAIPSKSLGLHLRNREMKVSLSYRLGLNVFAVAGPCGACVTMNSDRLGDHAIACGSQGERILRHNSMRDILFQTALQAGLCPAKEEQALIPGKNYRPADVFLPNWRNGRSTCVDITIVSSLQQALVEKAADSPGAALEHALQRKNNQSKEDCEREGLEFLAMPVEVLGGFAKQSVEVVERLGRQLARQTGGDISKVINHLFQRLSIILMKYNSALITSRNPTFPNEMIDGDRET